MQSMYRIALGDIMESGGIPWLPSIQSESESGVCLQQSRCKHLPTVQQRNSSQLCRPVSGTVQFWSHRLQGRDRECGASWVCSLYSLRASPFPNSSLGFMTRRLRHILGPPPNDVPFHNCTLQWETVPLHNLEMLGNIPSQALFPSLSAATGSLDC